MIYVLRVTAPWEMEGAMQEQKYMRLTITERRAIERGLNEKMTWPEYKHYLKRDHKKFCSQEDGRQLGRVQ